MFFMGLKGYIYTIAVDIYAFRLAFSAVSHRVLHHFTLRFAPFHLVFCTKTHCVLHHIALRFAPYCTAFCTILHYILRQMAKRMVQMTVL